MSGDHLERLQAKLARSEFPLLTDADFADLRALVAEVEKLRAERAERDDLERALIEIDAKNRRLLDRALKAEAEVERARAEHTALLDGNQRLQTMNEGLRQLAIEAREAANGWHQATIDLYSGRQEPQQPERDNFVDLATRTHLNYVPGDEQREQDSAVSGGDGGAWRREPEGGADTDGAQ